jgi:hypothetical protein
VMSFIPIVEDSEFASSECHKGNPVSSVSPVVNAFAVGEGAIGAEPRYELG